MEIFNKDGLPYKCHCRVNNWVLEKNDSTYGSRMKCVACGKEQRWLYFFVEDGKLVMCK
jgi:hypothetical protein